MSGGLLQVGDRVCWQDSGGPETQHGEVRPFVELLVRFPALAGGLDIDITAVLPDGAPRPIPVTSAALCKESR